MTMKKTRNQLNLAKVRLTKLIKKKLATTAAIITKVPRKLVHPDLPKKSSEKKIWAMEGTKRRKSKNKWSKKISRRWRLSERWKPGRKLRLRRKRKWRRELLTRANLIKQDWGLKLRRVLDPVRFPLDWRERRQKNLIVLTRLKTSVLVAVVLKKSIISGQRIKQQLW